MSSRWIALGNIVFYLGFLLAAGLWTRRRSAGFRDYVTGGGSIPAWMLALSFMANYISSNSFVGHAAKSYQLGLSWCVVGAIVVVCCAVSWHVFAPRFASFAREHGAETLPDFFEKRFRSRVAGQASLSFRPLAGIVELTTLAGALTAATLPAICVGFTSREVPASRVVLSILAGTAGVVVGKVAPGYLGLKSPWIQDVFVGLLASTLVLFRASPPRRADRPT